MEKNLKQLTIFFTVLLSLYSQPILAEVPELRLYPPNTSAYPEIQIEARRLNAHTVNRDQFSLTETFGETKKFITDLQILESKKSSPLRVYLSIPSFRNAEERYWILQFASSIAKLCEKTKGKFYLHVIADDEFLLYENINSEKMATSFHLPSKKESKFPVRSLEKLLEVIKKDKELDAALISVFWTDTKGDLFRADELGKKIQSSNLPYYLYAFSSPELTHLTESARGFFYPMEKRDSFSKLLSDLQTVSSPKIILSYQTPWKKPIWEKFEIQVDVALPNQTGAKFIYEENFTFYLLRKAGDPFLFFPVFIFLILICFSVLYYLKGFEEKQSIIRSMPNPSINSPKEFRNDANLAEVSVYRNLYGSVHEKAREREALEKILEKESVSGIEYGYGSLVQKDGIKAGYTFALDKEEIILGRGESCDFVIWDNLVEPRHAKIKKVNNCYVLFDMASELGVYLNGKKLLRPKTLTDLDEIKVGRTVFSFRGR